MRRAIAAAMIVVAGGGVVPASAQPFVYVLGQTDDPAPGNRGLQYVTVIDAATNAKVTRVTADYGCQCVGSQGLAMSRDGAFVVVANEPSNTVTVIATATNTVVDTMSTVITGSGGPGPIAVTFSPDNTRLYVLSNVGAVEVFSWPARTRLGTVPLSVVQSRGMDISPDGTRLYVSTYGSNTLKVVDTASLSVVTTMALPAGGLPLTVVVSLDGRWIYVAEPFINGVAVVDAQTNTVVTTVPVGTRPYTIGLAPGGGFLYAVNGNSASVSRVDTTTRLVTATTTGISNGRGVGFTPDGATAWVAGSSIYAVSTATNAVVGTPIPWSSSLDGLTAAIAVTPGSFTPPPPPSNPAPTNLVASVVGNRVSLTWTAPTSGTPTGYVLEGGLTPSSVLASLPTGTTGPAFTFDAPTGTFYIRIHALTPSGRSPASNEVMIRVNVPTPPAAPTGLLGLVNGNSLALAWQNPGSGGAPTSVLLDVSGAFTGTLPLAPAERFLFVGVPPGTYTFAVRAANAAGTSAASSPVTLTFPGGCSGAPQTPANLVVTRSGSTLSLSWGLPAAGAAPTSYRVNVDGALVATVPLVGRSISGAVPPGTYSLSVTAANACGQSAPTPSQSVTVP